MDFKEALFWMNKRCDEFASVEEAAEIVANMPKSDEVAKIALQKQIPLTPDHVRKVKFGIYRGNCKACGGVLSSTEDFCCRCGQRIDWSFANEKN